MWLFRGGGFGKAKDGEGRGGTRSSQLLTSNLALPGLCPKTLELLLALWQKSPGPAPVNVSFWWNPHGMWKPQAGKLQLCLVDIILFTDQMLVASEPESHSIVARGKKCKKYTGFCQLSYNEWLSQGLRQLLSI